MGFERSPVIDGGADGERLLHLAEIDEIREIPGEAEIAEHGRRDPLVAAGILLVVFHHRRGDVHVRRACVGLDYRQRGVGLEAARSEERRVGKACVSRWRSRWAPYQ